MAEFTLKARPLAFHASCDKPYLNASCKVIIPQSILQTLMDMSGNTIHSPIAFLLSQGYFCFIGYPICFHYERG